MKPGVARFVRFVALGGCAAAVNYGSRFALSNFMPFEAAVAVAYLIGMVVAFGLFRLFVFPNATGSFREQTLMFVLVNIAGIAQVWVVAVALARWALPALHYPGPVEATAHLLAIGVPTFTSYVLHKRFTFRSA
jgi:putative flippase GtrA